MAARSRRAFGIPYARGLKSFGLDPRDFLMVRCRRERDAAWTMEEALRIGAGAVVGARPRDMDLTASRRLQLAAQHSGTPIFLLRAHDDRQPSAAVSRWRVGRCRRARPLRLVRRAALARGAGIREGRALWRMGGGVESCGATPASSCRTGRSSGTPRGLTGRRSSCGRRGVCFGRMADRGGRSACAEPWLAPGELLADVRARIGALDVREAQPEADRQALVKLARWAACFSPYVAPWEHGLTFDIEGCAHLFGGEERMARQCANGFPASG